MMCLNIGTSNNHHFPFRTNGKVVVLDVPILRHFRVSTCYKLEKNRLKVIRVHIVVCGKYRNMNKTIQV